MNSFRALPGAIVVGAVAVASIFAAAPASAATLPAGQKISVVEEWGAQFYNTNPANAESVPVGTPDLIDREVAGIDVDDAGLGYAVANNVEDFSEIESLDAEAAAILLPGSYLYTADANSGKLSEPKQVIIDTNPIDTAATECTAIDYSKSVILAACFVYAGETATTYIGTVDVSGATAVLSPKTTLTGIDYIEFTAIAVNPVDGVIWGFDHTYKYEWNVWTITLDNALPVKVDDVLNYEVRGADFDRGGQLWLSVDYIAPETTMLANVADLQLATFNFTTNQPVVVDSFSSAAPYEIDEPASITVWGALAATGSTMTIAPAIAASLILLAGALLAAGTMVLRRRNADA